MEQQISTQIEETIRPTNNLNTTENQMNHILICSLSQTVAWNEEEMKKEQYTNRNHKHRTWTTA